MGSSRYNALTRKLNRGLEKLVTVGSTFTGTMSSPLQRRCSSYLLPSTHPLAKFQPSTKVLPTVANLLITPFPGATTPTTAGNTCDAAFAPGRGYVFALCTISVQNITTWNWTGNILKYTLKRII